MFDVVAKNPQINQIADEVCESPVHEHGAEDRKKNGCGAGRLRDLDGSTVNLHDLWCGQVDSCCDFSWDDAPSVGEGGVPSCLLEEKKDGQIGQNEDDRDIGRTG